MTSEEAASEAPGPRRRPGPARDYGLWTGDGDGPAERAARSYGLEDAPAGHVERDRPRPTPAQAAQPSRDEPPAGAEGGQTQRPAAEEPVEARPRPAPAERVEVPGRPGRRGAGPLERAVVTAVTASIATRLLTSLFRRRRGGR